MDAIARAAHVNKAMLYYHFASKLGLYREIVRDMLRAVGDAVSAIADGRRPAARKIERFIETLASQRDARPWFPPLMLREMAEGAPQLDPDTLALVRTVFVAFASHPRSTARGDRRLPRPCIPCSPTCRSWAR